MTHQPALKTDSLVKVDAAGVRYREREREEQEREEQTPQQGDDLIAECAEQALASDFRLHWANAVSSSGALSIPSGIPVLSPSNTFLNPPPALYPMPQRLCRSADLRDRADSELTHPDTPPK